ncbi:hypothetical protein, partial [Faecalicatena contorta]|uniref:glucosamine inositolphosphorylceramide transferase family protein n=1 Tax=Faecalicatena contorta TaxID=39482 RepID=UPI001F3B1C3B
MTKLFSKLLEDGWNVAFRQLPEGEILDNVKSPFQVIPNTWRTWEADPFVLQYEGNTYIFAEMYDYIKRRGAIGYTKWENDRFTPWKKVICEPFHMSYPNVFIRDDGIYMLPETSAGHKLLLYKAVNFPEKWEQHTIIAENVMWVDTTFFENRGVLYAITTDVADEENHKDYLLKFDDQFSISEKYQIHEKDIDRSRCGGRFFVHTGKLIRVSQDCSQRYGGALIFSEMCPDQVVDKGLQNVFRHISPEDLQIAEKKKWIGLHTYNAVPQFEVIDIEKPHFNIFGIIIRVLGKVYR